MVAPIEKPLMEYLVQAPDGLPIPTPSMILMKRNIVTLTGRDMSHHFLAHMSMCAIVDSVLFERKI